MLLMGVNIILMINVLRVMHEWNLIFRFYFDKIHLNIK